MHTLEQELDETIKAWSIVSKVVSTLYTEEQYNKAVRLLDNLIDEVSNKEDPLIESLIDTLGILIKDYEDRNLPEPEGDPIGCLNYLMEEHNLRQIDLKEILGNQEAASAILSGKKKLDLSQIKALSKKFNVSPAVFI